MKSKRLFLILVVIFVGFLAAAAWLLPRALVPLNPQYPYFPEEESWLGGVRWTFGSFQPVYLYSFTRDGSRYFKVAYRDNAGSIRLMDVMVGGMLDGSPYWAFIVERQNNLDKITQSMEYGQYLNLKPGSRVRIVYIRNVSAMPRSRDVIDFDDTIVQNLCSEVPRLCQVAKIVLKAKDAFWSFRDATILPENIVIPALYIGDNLVI